MPQNTERGLSRSGRFTSDSTSTATDITIIRAGTGSLRIHNSGDTAFTVKPEGAATVLAKQIPLAKQSSVDVKLTGDDVVITKTASTAVEGLYDYVEPLNPIRSGRFKGDAGASAVILQGREGELYRILNSGKQSFDVKITGSTVAVATVRSKHSVDIGGIDMQVIITGIVSGNTTFPIQGIYDQLDRRNPTRSGRFKIKQPAANPAVAYPIINLTHYIGNAWYRIFNSGDHPITILEGTATITTLNSDQSFDFKVGNSQRIISVKSAASNQPIEGIYDFIR